MRKKGNKIKIRTVLTAERNVKDAVVVGENGDAQVCIRVWWPARLRSGVVQGGYGEGTPVEVGYRAKCTGTVIWECTGSTAAPGPQHGSPHTTSSGRGALWR
jgi:hypothetical protein